MILVVGIFVKRFIYSVCVAVSCREDQKRTQRDHDEHEYTIHTGTKEAGCDPVSAERFRGKMGKKVCLFIYISDL